MNLTERIEAVILSNLQPSEDRKIGIECECFFYNADQKRIPTNPTNSFSATDFLNEMKELQTNDETKAGYSLEPGGQLEWASPPLKSLHEINSNFVKHKNRVAAIVKREKLKIVNYSLEPIYVPSEIELIDNEKYRLMNQLFVKTGNLGQWMMRNTSSVQINIDFSSREEAERMAYIADCLSPLTAILFANSPFWKGKSGGNQNLRYRIWNNTDNSRCGDLLDHGIETSEGIVKKYAKYIQSVPAIFIEDARGNPIPYKNTLGKWLEELFDKEQLTDKHIQIALHQIFTHIRFKNVLEIRGSDRPPSGFELAPAAFWIGLLLDDKALEEIFNILKTWTDEERYKLNLNAYILDLNKYGPDNKSIGEWINTVCNLSLRGLVRRGKNEDIFLRDYLDTFNEKGIFTLYTQKNMQKDNKTVRDLISVV